jgi:hypothetical protein
VSKQTRQRRADAKAERHGEILALAERSDDKGADEHRRAAAHAHVMTHHALEMDTAPAHKAAAEAHQGVADMHMEAHEELEEEESPPSSEAPAKKR